MHVDFAFLCDYADANGKINAIGIGFDTLFAPSLPVQAAFHFVSQLRLSRPEGETLRLEFALLDAEGQPVTPPLSVSGKASDSPSDEGILRVVIGLHAVLPTYGTYAARLKANEQEIVRIPFVARMLPARAASQTADMPHRRTRAGRGRHRDS